MKYYELELGRQKVGMRNIRQQTEHEKLIQVCSRRRFSTEVTLISESAQKGVGWGALQIRHEQQTMLLHVSNKQCCYA